MLPLIYVVHTNVSTSMEQWQLTSHLKGQITVGFCSFVAYFNQLLFTS